MTEAEDRLLAWDEVPPEVRVRVIEQAGGALPPHDALWACPRRKRGGWFRPDTVHTEYWWIDADGQLVEVFWFD